MKDMGAQQVGRILVIDDERGIRLLCKDVLTGAGYQVELAESGEAGLSMAAAGTFDLILCDINLPGITGLQVLEELLQQDSDTTLVLITAYPSVETAVKGMKLGARDYLTKPFGPDELRMVARRAVDEDRLRDENLLLRRRLAGSLIGKSSAMQKLHDTITKVANSDATVLVVGESGTGKELVARAIHYAGWRAGNSFVAVNCGALVKNLLEGELFGHKKGAFTGAEQNKPGLFVVAHNGTLFLDEVGDLPVDLQPKLLRALQEREVMPVGGREAIAINTRVVAATNRELSDQVAEGAFREDLYYRLNVIKIEVPPLRDRISDVPLLAEHFLTQAAQRNNRSSMTMSGDAMAWLCAQPWPGNIRQLENAIERAVVLAQGAELGVVDFDQLGGRKPSGSMPKPANPDEMLSLDELERLHILKVLAACEGQKAKAAAILGINRSTLWKKLRAYGVE
jgi:DNA-binding NtrC family response regulator